MAFYPTDAEIGAQAITDTLTTQMHTLGKRIRAYDPTTYGYGEFVYLKGIASTVVGSLVTYNPQTGVTALATTRARGVAAVAMSINNLATLFGWYQTWGLGVIKVVTTGGAGATVYATSTAGSVDAAVVAGDIVYGATFASAIGTPSAGLATVALENPYCGDTDNA